MRDWDIKDMATAEELATAKTAETGDLHIATDAGQGCWPKYKVIEAPKVGDTVSRYFNGDGYPAGKIVRVSASLRRVETEDGTVFWRLRQSACWKADRTWNMIAGVNNDYNRSF